MDIDKLLHDLLNNTDGRSILMAIVERSLKTALSPPRDLNGNILFTRLEAFIFEMIKK